MTQEAAAMSLNQWKQIMCYLAMIICWSLNINVGFLNRSEIGEIAYIASCLLMAATSLSFCTSAQLRLHPTSVIDAKC